MATEAFTPTEAAAFLDVPERQVRKEIEHGLFSTKLGFQALVYLGALRQLGFDLRVADRRKLFEFVVREVDARRDTPDVVSFSTVVMLRLGPLVREVGEKVERFARWREKLVTDPNVLAGEPVFPKSRLSVRNVGAMLERGAAHAVVLEDYPYLDDEDLEFARLFVRAYPKLGRPRETGQAPAR